MRQQVIVTSYIRPAYLKRTVASLRRDPETEIYIVDGGSDEDTKRWIVANSDDCVLLEGNPGADTLKTTGIKRFVSEPVFMLSSDDLIYPPGAVHWAMQQYEKLNSTRGHGDPEWTFVACSMDYIDKMVSANGVKKGEIVRSWKSIHGVDILEVSTCQVSGALIDTAICKKLGYFPTQYGRSGAGDRAFSKRLRDTGIRMGYLRRPCLVHIGAAKATDYPEYTRNYDLDAAEWRPLANKDLLRETNEAEETVKQLRD